MMLTRRRLIAISAVLATVPGAARAKTAPRFWTGQALGARASIRIDHPDADVIVTRVMAEVDRLENILSLYRPHSALSRLNRDGHLAAPPFELLECLSLAGAVYRASDGRFDPTVQPLWRLWAESGVNGKRPDAAAVERTRADTGWGKVKLEAAAITLHPGMALTLNGIGQGYVADRVAVLLNAEGLTNVLIDTGELRALGGRPEGGEWPVRLETGERLTLRQRALATSAPLGTTFDQAGRDGHILDPATGVPAPANWCSVSVSAASAAIADALATAACLLPDDGSILAMIGHFEGARLEGLSRLSSKAVRRQNRA
ncbi:FAD:protein FMN transferase [Ensifer sp. M14]|uniref:FAD:protein FMN transferase n=1 Tax=Sinorhizobium/Ensifer group TaxID=227292 RepID=UPI000984ED45|nr:MULTISPECIES: FAD:protein FMN transferase [Sinorhizobium/Ensifer group]OOG69679.1 thiamine biosynthesis protein ApbE [Sinorhizobium sp. A49]RDL46494.1 FAD:protein FMN transferase [Ensifer sp. M14]